MSTIMITLLVPMMIDDYEIPYSFCRAFLSEIYFHLVYLQLHDRIKIHRGVLTDKQKIFLAVIGWKHSCTLYLQHRQGQVTQADTFLICQRYVDEIILVCIQPKNVWYEKYDMRMNVNTKYKRCTETKFQVKVFFKLIQTQVH